MEKTYFFGRLDLSPEQARYLLDRDGCVGRKADYGVHLAFYRHTADKQEALGLVEVMRSISQEIVARADAIEQSIEKIFIEEED